MDRLFYRFDRVKNGTFDHKNHRFDHKNHRFDHKIFSNRQNINVL